MHRARNVELSQTTGYDERLTHEHLQDPAREIALELFTVDDNVALARLQPDARYGVLSLAGAIGAAKLIDSSVV